MSEEKVERFCPICKKQTLQIKQTDFKVMTVFACTVCHVLNFEEKKRIS